MIRKCAQHNGRTDILWFPYAITKAQTRSAHVYELIKAFDVVFSVLYLIISIADHSF